MNIRSGWIRGAMAVALIVGMPAVPEADAKGGRGGHGGGHGGHPPRVPAAHRAAKAPSSKPPRMPHASTPAHNNAARAGTQAQNTHSGTNHATASATHRATSGTANRANATTANHASATANHAGAAGSATNRGGTGSVNAGTAGVVSTTHGAATNPFGYTYGTGSGARSYRAYGYGQGYRNRYNGRRSGYGRSQGNNLAIVSRLRSVHAGLARLDHDYQGHRVRAMHSISMAIRQLSHRSMIYGGSGFASGMNNGRANGVRQGGLGAGGRRGQPMSQAQSDARIGQSLRTLQGINMQLTSQGTNSTGHARARGHVQRAIRELNTALAIR
jgi:hypothetical protein